MISTKNFHPASDPKLLCTCRHPECDRRSVNQETLDLAQIARDIYGKPLTVTSGGRCPHHQEEAKKANPKSGDHPEGNGIDIACDGSNRGLLVKAGIDAGFNAIGVAKTFVHWGRRPELPEGHLVVWTY